METILVHSFQKNEDEEIRLTLREYKNRHYFDLRLYFQPENQREMAPSKKGLTLALEFLPELKRGLIKVEEEARTFVARVKQVSHEG
ncbi:MAG: transcriptional coactivator p15/PC4 family protein [Candidatus Omnitrophica bacterium]|nr:transcriptional coactivator p15/PC4 family protein [Candidatus Omnitrophota bacterium]